MAKPSSRRNRCAGNTPRAGWRFPSFDPGRSSDTEGWEFFKYCLSGYIRARIFRSLTMERTFINLFTPMTWPKLASSQANPQEGGRITAEQADLEPCGRYWKTYVTGPERDRK